MSDRARGVLKVWLVIGLCGMVPTANAQAGRPPGKGWKALKSKAEVFPESEDFQGIYDGYEHKVRGKKFQIYGHSVKARKDGKKFKYTVDDEPEVTFKKLPRLVKLGTDKDPRGIMLNTWGPFQSHWTSHWGATFKIGGQTFRLVDADGDGVLWERGEDALVVPGSRMASPFNGQAWTEKGAYEIASAGGRAWYRTMQLPRASKDATMRAWRILNAARQQAGINPLMWSESQARDCQAHTEYCETNKIDATTQESGKPGYSKAGAEAASQSLLGFKHRYAYDGINEQLSRAFALSALLNPELNSSGIGSKGKYFACNVRKDATREMAMNALKFFWPPHGAKDVPIQFCKTGEIPLPANELKPNGKPPMIGQVVLAKVIAGPDYKIIVTGPEGAKVAGYLTHPEGGVRHQGLENNDDLILFTPKRPLRPNTLYKVTLIFAKGHNRNQRHWEFRTGRKRTRVR